MWVRFERCGTIEEALPTIRSLEELNGFSDELKRSKAILTETQKETINVMRIGFQKRMGLK